MHPHSCLVTSPQHAVFIAERDVFGKLSHVFCQKYLVRYAMKTLPSAVFFRLFLAQDTG